MTRDESRSMDPEKIYVINGKIIIDNQAQKAWNAQGNGVVQVYAAGLAVGHIYTLMKYVNGPMLKWWLESEKPTLGIRWNLAWSLGESRSAQSTN